jgi:photosystem II stability/assembly factor-like uncharacterized protein
LNNSTYDLELTHDGGKTWSLIKTMGWDGDLEFVNEETGWAIAKSGDTTALVHTIDGGRTWQELHSVIKP